jgi:hypothetical protein
MWTHMQKAARNTGLSSISAVVGDEGVLGV